MRFGSGVNKAEHKDWRWKKRFAFLPVVLDYTKKYLWLETYWQYQTYSKFNEEWHGWRNLTKEEYDLFKSQGGVGI